MSSILSVGDVFDDAHWIESSDAVKVAFVFAGFSLLLSTIHIVRHLKNYTMPQVQLYVIRILLTCPVYAITSSVAIVLHRNGIYAEVVRNVYEAVVVYSFMNLILEFCGGETDCVYMMENEPRLRLPCPLCCMKPRARTMKLMRFCQRGVLQFIIIQPTVAVISLILLLSGYYYSPEWQILETIIYNISYIWALYCLYVFYLAVKQNIKSFRPIAKFATVKSIIFATYYQSLFLKLTLTDSNQAIMWNDLLLCLEMVLFAIALMFAFPVTDFQGGIPDRRVLINAKDIFTIQDILHDIYYHFNPGYEDYALQRSQSEMPMNTLNLMNVHTISSSSNNSNSNSNDKNNMLQSYDSQASDPSDINNTLLESGQLNGKLNSVAYEMAERYRGRSKRMAFNSLLRGTQPIRAKLRSSRDFSTDTTTNTRIMMLDIESSSSSSKLIRAVREEESALLEDSNNSNSSTIGSAAVHSILHPPPPSSIHHSSEYNEAEEAKASLEDNTEAVFPTQAPSYNGITTTNAPSSGTHDSINHLGRLQIGKNRKSSRKSPTGSSGSLVAQELKSSRKSPTGSSGSFVAEELKSSRKSPTGSSSSPVAENHSHIHNSSSSCGISKNHNTINSSNSINNSSSMVGQAELNKSMEEENCELAGVAANHDTTAHIHDTNSRSMTILEVQSTTVTDSTSSTTNTTSSSTSNTATSTSSTYNEGYIQQNTSFSDQPPTQANNEIEQSAMVSKSPQLEQKDEDPCTDVEEWGDFA